MHAARLLPDPVLGKQTSHVLGGQGAREQIALRIVTPDRPQLRELLGSLHAFGDHVESEILCQQGDGADDLQVVAVAGHRSEEHTSELQSLMRISYAVFCLKKQTNKTHTKIHKI